MTSEQQTQAILEQLLTTVAFLCEEIASLVEERAYRTDVGGRDGVLGKAEQIRLSADSLRTMLGTLN
jgi:hypothetical protein